MVIVVMGVSGSGKSTVGRMLAGFEGWDFQEGDELHSQANIDKMSAGIALDDDDRWPWLDRIAAWIAGELQQRRCGVVTCSALKRSYRDRLRRAGDGIGFAYIDVPQDELARRLQQRRHFMPASLLDSQLQSLEVPTADELALIVPGKCEASATVAAISRWIKDRNS